MYRIVLVACLLVVCGCADAPPRRTSETYESIVAEWEAAVASYMDAYGKAENDEARQALVESTFGNLDGYCERMLAAGEASGDLDVEFKALRWVVEKLHQGPVFVEAVRQLTAKYIQHEDLTELIQSLTLCPSQEVGDFLLRVSKEHPERRTRGVALYYAGQLFGKTIQMSREFMGDDSKLAQFREHCSVDVARYGLDSNLEARDVVETLQEVMQDYGDIKIRGGESTLGDLAASELYAFENLQIGCEAPEIEGEDIDGQTFKLSDYRGKVVLLSFWGDW